MDPYYPQCAFAYVEVPGGTQIPPTPVRFQEFRLTNLTFCPAGAYNHATWPSEGCILDCTNFHFQHGINLCISTGYVTDEKSVLLMSCTTDNVTNNPTTANMGSCEDFDAWIQKENSTTSHRVRESRCGWCRTDRCIPDGFEEIAKGAIIPQRASTSHNRTSSSNPPMVMLVLVGSVLFAMVVVTVAFITRAKHMEAEQEESQMEMHTFLTHSGDAKQIQPE